MPGVQRTLRELPDRLRQDVSEIVLDLRDEPRPPDSQPLQRELTGLHRIQVDGWRIIYAIDEEARVVRIESIRPRSEQTYLNL
jgi:mRNA-degrading endonuclease RelE of RelBE toxin-antitoxin system